VVGKPPQEDYFIGSALQEMMLPLLKFMHPAVSDLWAYPETGFHPLAVAAVRQRYPHEALKHALGLMGQGQLSLTKVMIVVDAGVNARDFACVSQAMWENLDAARGLHLLSPASQDTLDFTGPAMNTGSKLILLATRDGGKLLRTQPPADPPSADGVHRDILALRRIGPAVLVAQLGDAADKPAVREALATHPVTREYLLHVLVSADVPIADDRMVLWGWFTRFDPLADLHPARCELAGNRAVLHFPIAIDATWKSGYRQPVAFDGDVERRVAARWGEYGIGVRDR
jgi:3-polyprenyl-4-hydroxybenzoate decarboxylase